ncbi:MAG: beta-ketoacyl-ACP synthase II [Chloroflexi bacterium]|nr:beta-ketoacyl-ACP synthase II [Chloroflexota bacterium]MBP8058140.1 beta-ketoacyl-ACP synthase II [Chloroflexota bacterium]
MSNNNHTPRHRVVVTGTGMITPLGHNVPDTWAGILAGKSGFGPFTLIDKGEHSSGGLCEVKEFDPGMYMDRKEARRRDRVQQFATVAAAEALRQSQFLITDDNRENIGIFIGTGVGGLRTTIEQEHLLLEKGVRRISPFAVTMIMPNGAAGMLAIDYGIQGPTPTIATACASGNDAIGHAYRAIQRGEIAAALTGGVEHVLVHCAVAGFEQARATSEKNECTPQPFDKNRDGLIIGEGGGIMVLESLENAQARGATILGEIIGYGQTTDAYHITAPSPGGIGAARAITRAMADAGITPAEIDYISAHGTGTPLNDMYETMSIKKALGEEHAYRVAISSTKSMTGHIMGATGAIEAIFCLLAMRDQMLPPTINYVTPDPECDLDVVPNTARPAQVRVALNNAFGFGGHNAVLVIKQFQP